jgi:hypothetical protein
MLPGDPGAEDEAAGDGEWDGEEKGRENGQATR